MHETLPPAPDAASLSDIIAGYLQALERGETPDREGLLAAHPRRRRAGRIFLGLRPHEPTRGAVAPGARRDYGQS